MTLKLAKEQLIRLLEQDDNNVIALSGKWGTGKTHLWNEVKEQSTDDKVKKALYVSLFGQSSIDQVKRKLIEAAIPGVESHSGVFDSFKNFFNVGVKALSTHYKALAAINDLNVLLMAPVVLRGNVIAIDDIERKHERLGIDEVLGFIDEYTKQYGSRFVLVLNEDKLSSSRDQEKLWTTFREKVIDQEIRLTTSPDEAFSIAIGLSPSKYADDLKKATLICGLTNIRVVRKIIRVANQILGENDLEGAILARLVPSIVLFSAIHYRGLADGPDFMFVLAFNPYSSGSDGNQNTQETPEAKREVGWRMLLRVLGIFSCDDFEKQLVEFFESGLFEASRFQVIIDQYIAQRDVTEARDEAHRFMVRAFWDHRADEEQLVAEAAGFHKIAAKLDPFLVTQLDMILAEMPGGQAVGDHIIKSWTEAFKATNPTTVNYRNSFNKPLHKDIQAVFDAVRENAESSFSVLDACMEIIESRGWGSLQEMAMRRATVEDFDIIIREFEDIDKFQLFMHRMIEMRLQRSTYDPHFGTATQHFVEACRGIANDQATPRLARLITRLFTEAALAFELGEQTTPTSDIPDSQNLSVTDS